MLISSIDDERNDIYLHIDAKVKTLPEVRTEKAELFVLENRVDANWGDVSLVEAEYALFEAAYNSKTEYSYYHLLSGVDLPLKSQDYIHDFFDKYAGKDFIGYTELSPSPKTVRKVCRWHLFPRQFKSKSILIRGVRALFLVFQEVFGIYRNEDIKEGIKKGSQWVSITNGLVELLLSKKEWALKTFSHTFCADEIFVQTICWNSPFRENIFCTEDDGKGCMRLIGWKDGCLYDWSVDELPTLKESPALFARKFKQLEIQDFKRREINVDIFIICYNQGKYIEDAMRGVNSQIMSSNIHKRIVIADDNSPDNSLSIIKKCESFSDIPYTYLEAQSQLGMAGNYSRVINNISGDYVCILEGDDYWTDSGKLQKQIEFMEKHKNCMICYSDCDIVYESSDGIVERKEVEIFKNKLSYINTKNPLFEPSYQGNVTWLIRKEVFSEINILKNCSDIPLVILYEACIRGKVCMVQGASTAVFRRHIGSVSNSGTRYKQYIYKKNVFFIREKYISKFRYNKINQYLLYSEARKDLYPLAVEFNDNEIISRIDSFLKSNGNEIKQRIYRRIIKNFLFG